MKFTAEIYRTAAEEHAMAAFELYRSRRYVLAHYVAGLSVECILRAYRHRMNPVFDERHNLKALEKGAKFFEIIPKSQVTRVSAALGTVTTLWRNDHRFRSEAALRSFLVERKLYERIKGDLVKENTRRIVNAAFEVVNTGVQQWNN